MSQSDEKNTSNTSNQNNNGKKEWKFKQNRKNLTPEQQKNSKIAWIIFGIFMFLFFGQITFYAVVYNVSDWVGILVIFIVLVYPAYLSNAGMLMMGGGKPMDGGRMHKDGRRILGDGKTWRGFILGPLIWGTGVSLLIHSIFYLNWDRLESYIYALFSNPGRSYEFIDRAPEAAVNLFKLFLIGGTSDSMAVNFGILLVRVLCVSFATATGDLIAAYWKRRKNIPRGEPFWLVDQLDFIIMVLLVSPLFIPVNIDFLAITIFALIFTPCVTICANTITYLMGHKAVPY